MKKPRFLATIAFKIKLVPRELVNLYDVHTHHFYAYIALKSIVLEKNLLKHRKTIDVLFTYTYDVLL